MKLLQYPKGTFRGDCLRGLAGLTLISLLFSLGYPGALAGSILAGLAALFVIFIYTAWRRTQFGFDFGDEALVRNPDGRRIHWSALSDLSLAYYTTRRDQQAGWLELKLVADSRTIKVDSRLSGFNHLLQHALRAAHDNHLELSPATRMNLSQHYGSTMTASPAGRQG